MLYLESPIFFINSLQIHRDFQNPNQFYYFPAAPRIHQDRTTGQPAFQLLKYARDVTDNPDLPPESKAEIGGGFLTMTVDIGVDEEVLEDTRKKLAAFADGEVMLAPVPFHTGAVRLVALGVDGAASGQPPEQPTNLFVEKIFGSTKPSLYGDNLALLGLHLSQEGITLVEDSFKHGGGLIGVVYDLTYTGIRPSLEVKAEVDYERVYNRLDAQIGFQYAMISAELDLTLEWLREQQAIKIEITQYDPEMTSENPLRREAMDLIKNEIIAKMLKPSLQVPAASTRSGNPLEQVARLARDLSQPPPSGGGGATPAPQTTPAPVSEGERGPRSMQGRPANSGGAGGTVGGPSRGTPGFALSFSLKFVHQEERKKATLDFRVNQAVNRTAAPQGSLSILTDQLKEGALENLIREVNLDDPFFRELGAHIGVTGDWNELGIEKIVVNATYQPDPSGPIIHTAGWTFNSPNDPQQLFNVLLERNNPIRRYRYKVEAFLKDLAQVDSKSRKLVKEDITEQRDFIIHPANEFRPLLVTVEPSALDWAKLRQVDVILKYADPDNQFQADQLFSFRPAQVAPLKWIVYPVNPEVRWYEVGYRYYLNDANSTIFRLEPVRCSEEAVMVPGPFRGQPWRIQLIPAVDAEEVQDLSVEILFEKSGYRFHQEESFSPDSLKPRWVEIPVPDPDPKKDTYQVRWSITKADWAVAEFPWKTMQSTKCLLSDGVHLVETVKLVLTRSVQQAGLTSLVVTFESANAAGEVIDSDMLVLRGPEVEVQTDLLVMQGTPLSYRYRLKKVIGSNVEVLESPNLHERRVIVDI
jgi:hypothetical protein